MKVLIVDDRQEDRYLLEVLLKGGGYEVTAAENGAEALEKLRQEPADMIVSDILMPVMDGFQFCRDCNSDAGLRKIPFIFYTATYTDKEDEKFALSLGADRFIVKPTDPEVFMEILEGLCREVAADSLVASKEPVLREEEYLKAHSGSLMRKLEDNTLKLEEEVVERKRKEVALRKVNRAYKVLSTCNQLLIRAKEETELLQEVCGVIVTEGGYKLAWVGFAEQDETKTVRPVAQAGCGEGYLDTIHVSWADTDLGRGLTGTAIRTGKPSVYKNILGDPRYEPWRAEAEKRGYASSIALPVIVEKQTLGALNIYAGEPDAFDRDEIDLLMELASDLAYGVRALRTQAAHVRAEEEVGRLAKFPGENPNPVLRIAKEGTIIYANAASSLLLSAWQSGVDQPLPDEWLVFTRKVFRSGKAKNTEYEHSGRTYSLTFAPVADAGYTNVYGLEITARKKAEEVLRESEERYRSLTQTATDAIISIDSKGIIVSWNRGAQEMFGYKEEEALNKPLTLCMPQRNREAYRKGMKRLLATGEPHIVEKTVESFGLRKNGDEFPMELSLSSWETAEGRFFTEIIRDISERRKAEEEMCKLSHAVEQSPSAVIITDIEGNIEYVNPRFTQMSGYSLDEVRGKSPRILNPGELSSEALSEIEETITAGKEWWGELQNKKKNGELYWVSSSVSAIRDSEGETSHFLAVQEDISEKKLLEQQLTQAQKLEAIGALAGGVAHDFNNLLGVIIGYSDYLLTKLDREDQMYKIMEDIRKAGQRGAALTDQLLAFSRKQAIQPEILALNRVVAETEKILARLIGEDIELITDLEPELWLVKADQGQITQILMNFSVNARDAMAEGGKIIIKTENVNIDEEFCRQFSYARPGRFVRLSVEDTGCGMDQETLFQIFEPFFTTKEIGKGTGLGLSVIYGIVKQHEGWVNVYSEPGQGSVFSVHLPASITSEVKEAAGEVTIEELQGHGERVLLVEDEDMLRELSVRILLENGYVVFAAAKAEDALELFEREKGEFHIVFSDVVLPDIDGIKLVERLLEKKPELKVLLSSGYMDDKSRWPVIRERGFNFLQKPYTLAGLLKSMKKTLE